MDMATYTMGAVLAGITATAAMDLWQVIAYRAFGIPMANWAMLGRWFAHLLRGVAFHDTIAEAAPVRNELAIGWVAHYAVGIAYAALYLALPALGVIAGPSLPSAIIFALITVLAGWLLLQPGMGLGWFASKTPNPTQVRFLGLVNHTAFGLGLYLGSVSFTLN